MSVRPVVDDAEIRTVLAQAYGLTIRRLDLLNLGADMDAAVYRAVGTGGETLSSEDEIFRFVKLKRGPFNPITAMLPRFLWDSGLASIIPPLPTQSGTFWATLGEYTLLLYPFVEGENGFTRSLSPHQWRVLGQTLAQTHAMQLPQELGAAIPRETFAPHYCQRLAAFLARRHEIPAQDAATTQMLALVEQELAQIEQMLARTESLAARLVAQLDSGALDFVLCHTDIHAGNVLLETENATSGAVYVVDWDAPLLAPKERDLMFVGAGIAETWYRPEEEAWFYEGYGPTAVNPTALAYYRYARIVEDIAIFCEDLSVPPVDETGATAEATANIIAAQQQERAQLYRYLLSNFLPHNTLEMAHRAYANL